MMRGRPALSAVVLARRCLASPQHLAAKSQTVLVPHRPGHLNTKPTKRAFATTTTAADVSNDSSTDAPPPATPHAATFQDPRQEILAAALPLVAKHGWTEETLAAGAASLGFPAVAHGMFGRGAIELVEYAMAQIDAAWVAELEARQDELASLPSSRERLERAIRWRLRLIAPYLAQWPQALALGLSPHNLETTARGLAEVADELCVTTEKEEGMVLTNWYAHRATVCSVYVATELFFLTDYSEDYQDTWAFLERRLRDVEALSHAPTNVQEGVLAFQTAASAMASAVASLAQPAMMGALQKVPWTGTIVAVMHTALANLAAMAPASPSTCGPFQEKWDVAGKGGKEEGSQSSTDYRVPLEKDPYAEEEAQRLKK